MNKWMEQANCKGMDPSSMGGKDVFFQDYVGYDNDPTYVDSICAQCPVQVECLGYGIENKLEGVWGGVFLKLGRPYESANKHKPDEWWDDLRSRAVDA